MVCYFHNGRIGIVLINADICARLVVVYCIHVHPKETGFKFFTFNVFGWEMDYVFKLICV